MSLIAYIFIGCLTYYLMSLIAYIFHRVSNSIWNGAVFVVWRTSSGFTWAWQAYTGTIVWKSQINEKKWRQVFWWQNMFLWWILDALCCMSNYPLPYGLILIWCKPFPDDLTVQDAVRKSLHKLLNTHFVECCPAAEPSVQYPTSQETPTPRRGARSSKVLPYW